MYLKFASETDDGIRSLGSSNGSKLSRSLCYLNILVVSAFF